VPSSATTRGLAVQAGRTVLRQRHPRHDACHLNRNIEHRLKLHPCSHEDEVQYQDNCQGVHQPAYVAPLAAGELDDGIADETEGQPVGNRVREMMYAMVKKVVSPASSSVRTVVLFSERRKRRLIIGFLLGRSI